MLERFAYFINERHAMWRRRQQGFGSRVTNDPVLRDNHFTNVYRELDTGTIFAQESMQGLRRDDAIWLTVAYRMINRRQTMQAFGRTPRRDDLYEWQAFINQRYETKQVVKTNRHIVPYRTQYEKALIQAYSIVVPRNAREAFKALRTITGVGNFMGWQILCDLVEANHVDLDSNFIIVGDGATYALAVLNDERSFDNYHHVHNRLREGHLAKYQERIRQLRDTQKMWLPTTWIPWDGRDLDCKNIEHALCEWTKYERLLRTYASI